MKITKYLKSFFLFAFVSIFIISCATQQNLIKQGSINQKILSKDKIKISSLRVYEFDGRTIITGNIRRQWGYRTPVWGHVDIAWYSPKNELLGKQGTFYLPQHLSLVGASSKFKIETPEILELGSTVTVVFHNSTLDQWPTGVCINNKAVDQRKSI